MDDDKSYHDVSNKHGHSRNLQKFSEAGSSNAPEYKEERVENPKLPKISNEFMWPTCTRFGQK